MPEAVKTLGAVLLGDAAAFLARRGGPEEAPRAAARAKNLPPVAGDFAGLAAQLGQALAGLQQFEAQHARWSAAQKAFAWQTDGGELPVARLRPQLAPAQSARTSAAETEAIRRKLAQRIDRLLQR